MLEAVLFFASSAAAVIIIIITQFVLVGGDEPLWGTGRWCLGSKCLPKYFVVQFNTDWSDHTTFCLGYFFPTEILVILY